MFDWLRKRKPRSASDLSWPVQPQPSECTRAHLVSVERDRRLLTFTFIRNGETITVETYAMMGMNMDRLREGLGL